MIARWRRRLFAAAFAFAAGYGGIASAQTPPAQGNAQADAGTPVENPNAPPAEAASGKAPTPAAPTDAAAAPTPAPPKEEKFDLTRLRVMGFFTPLAERNC